MGLAELHIWISINVYSRIWKKNYGLELKDRFGFGFEKLWGWLKYRFGFHWMYIEELGRKMMGESQSTDLDLSIYEWRRYAENYGVGWSTDLDFIECM